AVHGSAAAGRAPADSGRVVRGRDHRWRQRLAALLARDAPAPAADHPGRPAVPNTGRGADLRLAVRADGWWAWLRHRDARDLHLPHPVHEPGLRVRLYAELRHVSGRDAGGAVLHQGARHRSGPGQLAVAVARRPLAASPQAERTAHVQLPARLWTHVGFPLVI